MKTNKTFTKIFTGIAILFSLFLMLKPADVQASHFRGGIVSWEPVGPDSARFTIYASFTRIGFGGFFGTGGDGYAIVGDQFDETIGASGLAFGDASSTGILRFEVISVDLGNNMLTAIALDPNDFAKQSIDHQYADAGPWSASVASTARSGSELNNPNLGYDLSSLVEFTTGNSSPTSSFPVSFNPILLPQDPSSSFAVTASDVDGNSTLRYRLATAVEAGDAFFVQPVGLSIDNITGVVSWDNSLTPLGFYSCQVVVEDWDMSGPTLLTSIDVDFLIHVCSSSTDADGDGFSPCDGDCDDTPGPGAAIYPGATEIACDGIDQDCNGFDLENPVYADFDGDGYAGTLWTSSCDLVLPAGYSYTQDDCDDGDNLVYPGAIEYCDGKDNDCDLTTDEACIPCPDGDGDGFTLCDDCNDGDPAIYPGAAEIACDGIDQNCNGLGDDASPAYYDADLDGYAGTESIIYTVCDALPVGYSYTNDDCNDNVADLDAPSIYPGATEICGDGIDQDCSGADLICPPVNDLCNQGTVIVCGDELPGTTIGATYSGVVTCPNGTGTTGGPDVWYVFAGNDRDVTISTCEDADFDTQISVYDEQCGFGNCVAGSDDACSFNRSSVTFFASSVTNYYIMVNGYNGATGDFTLKVQCCFLTAEAEATSDYNGYDVQCYGGSNGEATALDKDGTAPFTYEWSDGQTTNPATGLEAGTYQVTITDDNDCTATAEVTLNEPPQMTIDAGPNQLVYHGYPDSACATLVAESASGGVPPYDYDWSDGSPLHTTDVCPATSSVYYVTLTDANGCTVVDSVKVCAIDVRCGHDLKKVTICHETGSGTQTLCVALTGAKNHIQTHAGDQLAACGTLKVCSFSQPSAKTDETVSYFVDEEMLTGKTWLGAIPNPFADNTAIRFILPQDDKVSLKVFDVTGKEIARLFEGSVTSGSINAATFDGSSYTNGIYFLTLTNSTGERFVEKLVLTR